MCIRDSTSDTLKPAFKLYCGKKARGSFSGEILQKTDLSTVKVTKRLIATKVWRLYIELGPEKRTIYLNPEEEERVKLLIRQVINSLIINQVEMR